MKSNRVFVTLIFLLAVISTPIPTFAANNEAVAKVIRDFFESQQAQTFSEALDRNIDTVRDFYQSRNFKPVWTRDTGPKGKGKSLFQELNRSKIHGLSPEFYNVAAMAPLMKDSSAEGLARLDMLFSGAFIDYSHDLRNGRLANVNSYAKNKVSPIRFEASELISDAADAGNLRNLASEFMGTDDRYVRLIAKYVEFGRIAKSGLWPKVSADGKPIAKGQQDERMIDIRKLLLLSGDLPQSVAGGGAVHDVDTQKAVMAYQTRLGLQVSGEIDADTLRALSTPVPEKMKQILVNLERRRWQNRELGDNHIYINLADARARVVIDGKTAGFVDLKFGDEVQELPTFYGTVTGIQKTTEGFSLLVAPEKPAEEEPLMLGLEEGSEDKVLEAFAGKLDDIDGTGLRKLAQPLTVYVTYLTAWANKDGSINFRPDHLSRDGDVAKLLGLE